MICIMASVPAGPVRRFLKSRMSRMMLSGASPHRGDLLGGGGAQAAENIPESLFAECVHRTALRFRAGVLKRIPAALPGHPFSGGMHAAVDLFRSQGGQPLVGAFVFLGV